MITLVTTKTEFEILYDTYNEMLYGIAQEIAPSIKEAEQILIITFKMANQQNIVDQKYPSHCISLIKLLIKTAHEQINKTGKTKLEIKKFKQYPILHNLLCQQVTANDLNTNISTKKRIGEKLRAEFLLMRYANSKQKMICRS